MTRLILASHNRHKALEIQAILGAGFDIETLREFPNAPGVIEDADTFAGNAAKKSVAIARWLTDSANLHSQVATTSVFVLADDSGLEVDALHGAPGVYSARFAAQDGVQDGNSSDAANNAKLLRLLASVPWEKRTARFHCVIALTPVHLPGGERTSSVGPADDWESRTEFFEGVCEGRVGLELRGSGGFGYDPLFFPIGFERTFAELGETIKNQLSHRARALAKMRERLANRPLGFH